MNHIHPTAVISPDVELGADNVVGPFATIEGPCRIGDGNWIGPHAVVGTPAEIRGADIAARGGVVVGDNCVIREFVTIHQGTDMPTKVGSRAYLMTQAHVPHDAELREGVTLANAVHIGGHTWVGEHAVVGLGAVVHQFATIGAYAMIGMQSAVVADVPPFALVRGVPARISGINRVGLSRAGYDDADVVAAERWVLALASEEPRPILTLPDPLRPYATEYETRRAAQ